MSRLAEKLDLLNQEYEEQLKIGLWVSDGDACLYEVNSNAYFPSASTIKLAVYLHYMELFLARKIDLEHVIVIDKEDFVGGSGFLQLFPERNEWRIWELLQAMIAVSDNTATNVLISHAGIENIQGLAERFSGLKLQRLMMAEDKTKDNLLTPEAGGRLMNAIYQLKDKVREYQVLRPFLLQQFREGLPGLLDEKEIPGLQMFNKTGRIEGIEHDVAVFEYQGRHIAVSAFTQDVAGDGTGVSWLRRAGKIVFEELAGTERNQDN